LQIPELPSAIFSKKQLKLTLSDVLLEAIEIMIDGCEIAAIE
jgi:hypothetical protein